MDSRQVRAWKASGHTVLWILIDGEIGAACRMSDRIRSDSTTAVRALLTLGITPVMLTGDSFETARLVSEAVGITEPPRAGIKPSEKLEEVQRLHRNGVVGMIGDGVNDGPALASADVGIAMGVQGTAMAAEAAGVVLMTNDLRKIADAVVAARRCTRVMGISVGVALALKLVPFFLMASTAADTYLIVVAVASDVLGIAWVLLAATSLLHMKPQFARSPCGADQVAVTEIVPVAEGLGDNADSEGLHKPQDESHGVVKTRPTNGVADCAAV